MKKILLAVLMLFVTVNCFAAEFLIMAKNNWMIDADQTGWTQEQIAEANRQYRVGDIVQVFPDGKLSDYAHAGGKFYVIRVSGLSFKTAVKYQEDWDDAVTGEPINCRKYRIRVEDLPLAARNALKTTYVYNTTWTAVKSYVTDKIRGLNE